MQPARSDFQREVSSWMETLERQVKEFGSRVQRRHYSRNEEVVREGSPADKVYIISHGMLAVTRTSPLTGETHHLAYLKPGDLLGELEALEGPHSLATATATAVTQVDLLEIGSADFLDMLQRENWVLMDLSRKLAQRLRATTERLGTDDGMANRVCLIIGNERGVGVTTLGMAMSQSLAASTQNPTVYVEYPDGSRLSDLSRFASESQVARHPGGFDLALPNTDEATTPGLNSSIFFDQLLLSYPNLVVGLTSEPNESLRYLLERTDEVVIITSPVPPDTGSLFVSPGMLKQMLRADQTSVYVVTNRRNLAYTATPAPLYADFDIPFIPELPPPNELGSNLPAALSEVVATLVDRLKRTNQVRVYIPTTVDVDQQLDTSAYVQEALELLGNLFGGATSDSAQGVWKSESAGLVGETVYIVTSYVTKSDLDRHLERILDFVDRMKRELKQEAMALEVNERLMLI
ncbi:MAG: cyclic nucleotide-binding domain-containing protein [Chloroflexota bacterium]|nr:cyclic nucleotide-binding domain-containing protein [Chloroflexota bacterium]